MTSDNSRGLRPGCSRWRDNQILSNNDGPFSQEIKLADFNQQPKTPEQYFQNGRAWLDAAEDMAEGNQDAATLAILSMASALLGICAQFIRDQGDD